MEKGKTMKDHNKLKSEDFNFFFEIAVKYIKIFNGMKLLFLLCLPIGLVAQKMDALITKSETERIENYLSSNEMGGRKTFSPGIELASKFISDEFKKIKLETWDHAKNYSQRFNMYTSKVNSLEVNFDGMTFDPKKVCIVSKESKIQIDQSSGYQLVKINKEDNLFRTAYRFLSSEKPSIVLVDESFSANFDRLKFQNPMSENQVNVIFILANELPKSYSISGNLTVEKLALGNVLGVIPGISKPNEYVIFSGHYDHLGIMSQKAIAGDSIYNGANDDAAGTTAMIMLAKYYKKMKNNARTLVFVAFTAEEIGGYGSQYFSKQFKNPNDIVAMFNLEMIGTESKWGKNSAYITGFEKSSMGEILQKNLLGTTFTFYPDPYTDQNLFYRSDNATLAKLGVPAHTISTSKMDSEPNYHKPSDEVGTLDLDNMTAIIKAIAQSAKSIVDGSEAPTRVDIQQLK